MSLVRVSRLHVRLRKCAVDCHQYRGDHDRKNRCSKRIEYRLPALRVARKEPRARHHEARCTVQNGRGKRARAPSSRRSHVCGVSPGRGWRSPRRQRRTPGQLRSEPTAEGTRDHERRWPGGVHQAHPAAERLSGNVDRAQWRSSHDEQSKCEGDPTAMCGLWPAPCRVVRLCVGSRRAA